MKPTDPDYPQPGSAVTTRVMKANKGVDTKPEILLRSLLHQRGYRFRKNLPIVTGKQRVRPDVVFTRQKVAVFIDGCFWHFCPIHGHIPHRNKEYWQAKFMRNRERDRSNKKHLEASGWQVLRFWEHEDVESMCHRIGRLIAGHSMDARSNSQDNGPHESR